MLWAAGAVVVGLRGGWGTPMASHDPTLYEPSGRFQHEIGLGYHLRPFLGETGVVRVRLSSGRVVTSWPSPKLIPLLLGHP